MPCHNTMFIYYCDVNVVLVYFEDEALLFASITIKLHISFVLTLDIMFI